MVLLMFAYILSVCICNLYLFFLFSAVMFARALYKCRVVLYCIDVSSTMFHELY